MGARSMYVYNLAEAIRPARGEPDEALTVSTSAVAAATTWTDETRRFYVSIDGADVRVTYDGSAPVAGTNGHLFANGYHGVWSKARLQQAKFIRNAAADALVMISPMD